MKKSKMSARSLEDRRMLRQYLALAGWDVESWDQALETGADVEPEAEGEYAGPVFNLRLEYHAEHNYLLLEMVQRDGELFLRLRLYNDLALILARIIAAQDTIDKENYTDLIKSLILLCDPLLVETDEGLYRLS
jgi:hypothetical protein